LLDLQTLRVLGLLLGDCIRVSVVLLIGVLRVLLLVGVILALRGIRLVVLLVVAITVGVLLILLLLVILLLPASQLDQICFLLTARACCCNTAGLSGFDSVR